MIYILLPAYNEAENIRPLLEDIAREVPAWNCPAGGDGKYDVHAVVVNDGSADRTAEETKAFSGPIHVTLLNHDHNRGLAEALRTGLQFVADRGEDTDVLITLDADRTHSPIYMKPILDKLHEGYEIVVASRYAPGGHEYGVSLPRRILSRGAKVCYKMFFSHVPLRDFSCGFRGVRLRVAKATLQRWGEHLFETRGFACTGELMLKMLPQTAPDRVTEIGFELHYERKGGQSKMPTLKTIQGTLNLLMQSKKWR